jgi:hypothetical protein
MGHKSLETTMRYLAPATDVHDELDLVTIPSLDKAGGPPKVRRTRHPLVSEGGRRTTGCQRRRSGTCRRATPRYLIVPRVGA